jgi:hypothetical protein
VVAARVTVCSAREMLMEIAPRSSALLADDQEPAVDALCGLCGA